MLTLLERCLHGRMNRVNYIAVVVVALYLMPLLLTALCKVLNVPVWSVFMLSQGPVSLMAFWYLQIPLFAWGTLRRVQDVGWPRWAAALLWFPFLNFVLWFWPGEAVANRGGEPPRPAGWVARVLTYGAPVWILLAYFVVYLVLLRGQ